MLIQNVINALQSSELTDCNVKISLDGNGKPSLVIVFDKKHDSAKKVDLATEKLREIFTYPLFAKADSAQDLENNAAVELAHLIEELNISIDEFTSAQKVAQSRKKASKPTASKPTASKPTASKPTASKPTASKPTASKPTASKPTASKPTASKPTASKPTASKPTATTPASDIGSQDQDIDDLFNMNQFSI